MAGAVLASDTKMATQIECQAKWNAAKAEFLSQINDINNDTPWSNVEPDWWCEMMDAEKAVRNGGAK